MRERGRTWIVVAVFAGILLLTGQVMAQPGPAVNPKPAEYEAEVPEPGLPVMPGNEFAGVPNLTDAQREQIQALRIKHLKEVMPIETELRIKEIELNELWQAEKFDAKGILAKAKEASELRSKLELARVNHRIEIFKILTPEQRKAFLPGMGMGRGMMRGMGRKFGPRHGRGQMGGPGTMPCCPQR